MKMEMGIEMAREWGWELYRCCKAEREPSAARDASLTFTDVKYLYWPTMLVAM